ncbi:MULTISPECIES: RNA polymerase-binding protein RbpA [unclassified Schaalia]|uniref:RNA polymerase-binding protein RbpA n=1 Tax=unclassified Schaalia TaxID=2691889 RepID=UPI001E639178|nr:RNA polymerase-binding protein RbpA [Schaalia sp. lx-260]MCD4557989.1 RNA polymerase-binding protein RbpA [Schaalia sp. lx-100]
MADRALRGMQIGAKSMESEEGVVFADRYIVRYMCANGHEFDVTLSTEATAPATWECRCGLVADLLGDATEDEDQKVNKPVRTHWDMLCERRTMEELEEVLNEQLTLLREGRLRPEGSYQKTS